MSRTIEEYRAQLKAMLPELTEKFGVAELGLFGSRVRGDHRDDSDLDVLVTFWPGRGDTLSDLGGLEDVLESALGLKIDLTKEKNLRDRVRPYILHEVQRL